MNRVDLAQVVGQPIDEGASGKAGQEALAVQSTEDLLGRGLDVLRQAEPASLRDGDCAQLPGPVVDVTEDASLLRSTPVAGSAYGSSGIYGRR
jgi:hypothetical protein